MKYEETWNEVEEYISRKVIREPPYMESALKRSIKSGIPQISVPVTEGKLINIMAKAVNAKKALEIGVLWGYGTMNMASAMGNDGMVIGLERVEKHAEIARQNIREAGLESRVEIRTGDAMESLISMRDSREGPFDLIFIDADKGPYADYFRICLDLSHQGTIIFVDNMVWRGRIIESDSTDEDVIGIRRLYDELEKQDGIDATVIQSVGSKGYDGFAVIRVLRDTHK